MQRYTSGSAASTGDQQDASGIMGADGIDIDLRAWRATADKLTIRETGELVRSLVRAHSAKRPNREQRILLAIYMRAPSTLEEATQ